MRWTQTLMLLALATAVVGGHAQGPDEVIVQAREALRKKDGNALAAASRAANAAQHPLTQWVEYWELFNRLGDSRQADLDNFYLRWPATYVEDRLRNDWLLELGKRRDWANFRVEYPRFRMNDDREVTCYALLTQHLAGEDVRVAGRAAWHAQTDADDGCLSLATVLRDAKQLSDSDIWHDARLAALANRPRAARAAAALINPAYDRAVAEIWEAPLRHLQRQPASATLPAFELDVLALMRLAANEPEQAAEQLQGAVGQRLPLAQRAMAWAAVARQAAMKQQPEAAAHAQRAWGLWDQAAKPGMQPPWSDEVLAWHVRAALRLPLTDAKRWPQIQRAIEAMGAAEQKDPAWVYWKARAMLARAPAGEAGEAARSAARAELESISRQLHFYGKLATEELGQPLALPAPAAALTAPEREVPRQVPGFQRSLQLIAIGLRNEGVREWNFTLRGLNDRELLAAAQLACEREIWDRCINTSERTKTEVDMAQRFPTPHRELMLAKAKEAGVDASVVYGLIRQESRFIADVRSHVGASGLMQLMPATARWTAKQLGLPFNQNMINDRELNLQLGTYYFKRVFDDLDGSLAMAAAAYNAGPGRPRRWREGATMEPAAWAESIPFNETRDYVKKVISNSVYYAAMLGQPLPSLKARLGKAIGPRDSTAPAPNKDLP
jgi:soluble lytic murein transglycosylase